MIKQKYGIRFFVENYPYRANKMFDKYYKKLEEEYRYFILVEKNYFLGGKADVYRSNNSLENIIKQLDNMEFQVATITDYQAEFPQIHKYTYYKMNDMQYITAHYQLRSSESVQLYKTYPSYDKLCKINNNKKQGEFYRKVWHKDNGNLHLAAWVSDDMIDLTYGSVKMVYDRGKTYAYQYSLMGCNIEIPRVEIDGDLRDKIFRIIKAMRKDNIEGFYDDVIERIKFEFGLNSFKYN